MANSTKRIKKAGLIKAENGKPFHWTENWIAILQLEVCNALITGGVYRPHLSRVDHFTTMLTLLSK